MSENSEKNYVTLEEIVNSESIQELYIEALDKYVKIKNASSNDRIEAEKLAMRHPSWPLMTITDKNVQISRMLALQLLVEPKISYEDYIKADDTVMQVIIACVANEYHIKLTKLTEQNSANLKRFLEEILGEEVMSSLNSLNFLTTTSKEPERSGET